jgi:YD repeat-containing protein
MPSVYVPTTTTTCATGTTCSGTSNEVKTTLTYGSSGDPNQLYPRTVSIGAGNANSGQISTTTYTYTLAGDVATSDGPLSGSDDTTTYAYDGAHRVKSIIGPDPDGSGSRTYPVTRFTYNAIGKPTLIELGKVPSSSSDPWGSSFTLLGYEQITYYTADGSWLPIMDKVVGDGGAILSYTQTNYDSAARVNCVAARMIAAAYPELPASACTQSNHRSDATYDRILQYSYDNADRVTSVALINNVTSTSVSQGSRSYTNDGLQSTVTDENGHVTTYEYDAFDRLVKVRYPNPSSSGSSTSDYEQYTLDDAGNVTSLRARSGTSYSASYDALNRQTSTYDSQAIVYDNLDRAVSVTKSSASVSYTYGALGQRLTETDQNSHVVNYSYDLLGRRTQMIWPDNHLTIDYDWNLDGLKAIREDGVTSGPGVLASYTYDDLGRRTAISRGNGTSTSFTYETDSTLKTLTQTITSASNTTTFTRNRAGQILTKAITNSSYAGPSYSNGTSISTSYNNLNQVTSSTDSAGTHTYSYDSRGNISSDGTNSYTYDAMNRLLTGAGGRDTSRVDGTPRPPILGAQPCRGHS